MAVPIDLLKPILNDLLSRGCANRQPRPWLGLFGTEIEDRLVVAALSDDGPAEQAEVSVGDIVVKVAGQPVETLADFFRRVWSLGPAGVDVPITINRDGETFEMTIQSIDRNSLLKTPRLH
jgi:S1-C subfamily serine protease